jgi:flagellar hook-associated protein 1 FlgK
LSNNAVGSKFVGNDLSNPADLTQVQDQLSKLKPTSYNIAYDGNNYVVTDSSTGLVVPATNTVDDPAGHPLVSTLRFDGLQVDLDTGQGTVRPGDQFQVRYLNDGTIGFSQAMTNPDTVAYRGADTAAGNTRPLAMGNNVNAANMASMQNKKLFLNHVDSIEGVYSLMAGNVGSYHQSNQVSMNTQDALYGQLSQTQQSISGVNLDEEAANMMKFQQSYQAAAQMMQTSQKLFDTLIGVM